MNLNPSVTCCHATAILSPNGWHCPNCREFFDADPRPPITFQPGDKVRLVDSKVGRRRMVAGMIGEILEITAYQPFPIKVRFEGRKASTCVRPHQIELVSNELVSNELVSNAELVNSDDLTAIVGTVTLSDDPELDWLAELINREHTKCLDAMNDALYAARDCGKYLIKARIRCEQVSPRKWGKWLQQNFEGSRSSAYNYIAIAEHWHEKIEPFVQRVGQNSLRDGLRLLTDPSDDDTDQNDDHQNNITEQIESSPELEPDPADNNTVLNQDDYSDDAAINTGDRQNNDSKVLELDGFKVGDKFHVPPYVGELIEIIPEQARPFRIDWQDWKIIDYELSDLAKWTRIEPEPPQPPSSEGGKGDERDRRRQIMTSSNTDEHYTPAEVIEAVLQCFGGEIDLDPCSNSADPSVANVPARKYFTQEDDGLTREWLVNSVYCNPPYSQVAGWVKKITDEYSAGNCTELLLLVKADTSTRWFKQIWRNATAVCFPDHRLPFIGETSNGGKAPFASAIAYFGNDLPAFWAAFDPLGVIVQRITGDMLIDEYGQMAG